MTNILWFHNLHFFVGRLSVVTIVACREEGVSAISILGADSTSLTARHQHASTLDYRHQTTPFMSPSIHNPRMVCLTIILRMPATLGANDMLPSRTTSVCCPLIRHGYSVYRWRRDRICPHTFYPIHRCRNWVRIVIAIVSWFV